MRADARANRQALVAAARELIAAQGADVALATVAERAGVGIATLYRNFPDREALVRAIVADVFEEVRALVADYRPRVQADAGAGWPGFVHALADLGLAALASQVAESGRLPAELLDVRQEGLEAIESILAMAKAAGLVRADVTATRLTLAIALLTRPLPPAIPAAFGGLDDQTPWLIDTVLRGLRPVDASESGGV